MTKFKAPRIIEIQEKKLVGHSIVMSLSNNKTHELFSGFMPNRKDIQNVVSNDIYEVIEYEASHFKSFSPTNEFTKWATVEVSDYSSLTKEMKTLTLSKGLYAVFHYRGLAKDFSTLMQYIYGEWLPQSEYTLDDRPHFNLLGEKYKNNHPDSEEAVYIPIMNRTS